MITSNHGNGGAYCPTSISYCLPCSCSYKVGRREGEKRKQRPIQCGKSHTDFDHYILFVIGKRFRTGYQRYCFVIYTPFKLIMNALKLTRCVILVLQPKFSIFVYHNRSVCYPLLPSYSFSYVGNILNSSKPRYFLFRIPSEN